MALCGFQVNDCAFSILFIVLDFLYLEINILLSLHDCVFANCSWVRLTVLHLKSLLKMQVVSNGKM